MGKLRKIIRRGRIQNQTLRRSVNFQDQFWVKIGIIENEKVNGYEVKYQSVENL